MNHTNVSFQTETKVNTVCPEIIVVEADSLHALKGGIVDDEMASLQPFQRDIRQWHDIESENFRLFSSITPLKNHSIPE